MMQLAQQPCCSCQHCHPPNSGKSKLVDSPGRNDLQYPSPPQSSQLSQNQLMSQNQLFQQEQQEVKKTSELSKVQRLKKRLQHSFSKLALTNKECLGLVGIKPSRSEFLGQGSSGNDSANSGRSIPKPSKLGRLKYAGYSAEFLDRVEPNGNILNKDAPGSWDRLYGSSEGYHKTGSWDRRHGKPSSAGYEPSTTSNMGNRQLSVSSDTKLLEDEIHQDVKVIVRPKRPPRPQSEVLLDQVDNKPRTKRYSAFGGDSPFGKLDAYIKLEQLGEGSYATVFKGYSNLTHQVVALKEIRLQEEEGAPFTAIREASLLKELKHTNIVTLHDIIHTKSSLTFVFEYVNTDLSQYLDKHAGGLHPKNAKLFLFQLFRGLSYCHKRRILHRDVKPQNLLISEMGELKLADFGLARAKSVPSHTYSHEVVTLWYRPPDVLLGSTNYTTSLDIWGVGCIFVEMLNGCPCFPGVRDVFDQLDKIFRVVGTPTEEVWPGVTRLPNYRPHKLSFYRPQRLSDAWPILYDIPFAENLANQLLQQRAQKRIGAEQALRHRYFSDLPQKIHELGDEESVFSVQGVKLWVDEKPTLSFKGNFQRNHRRHVQ